VLPATSQLEHFDLHASYGHHYLQANRPCIPPCGQARPNTEVFRELARRLGLERDLFEPSDEDLARVALWEGKPHRPAALEGITLERLLEHGSARLNLPQRFTPFAHGGFPTPSGRCELYSQRMAGDGLDPLPCFIPPAESAEGSPDLFRRYPLQLISPPSPHFLNSTFVNVPTLREAAGQPELEMHHQDAAQRGIAHGQQVRVFNDRGAFLAVAAVNDDVRPGVVVAPSVWWNKLVPGRANANATTSTRLTDMGGGATFFDNLVEVVPVDAPSP